MSTSVRSPEAQERRREQNREYERLRAAQIREQIAKLPQVECECGCGTLIPALTLSGKPRRFADNHGSRSPKFHGQSSPWAALSFPVFDDDPLCADQDPDVFWDDDLVGLARSICVGCPVREQCLAWAMEHGETEGVWGGMSAKERIKAQRAGGPVEPHQPTREELLTAVRWMTSRGDSAERIAERLGLSRRTVHRYRMQLKEAA